MSDKLKPCPFCGSDKIKLFVHRTVSWARCTNCYEGSRPFATKEEVIAHWNTRKPMERIVERLNEIAFTENTKEYGRMEVVSLEDALNVVEEEGGV